MPSNLLREYEVRRVIDDMPDLAVYGSAYDDLRRASEKLKMAKGSSRRVIPALPSSEIRGRSSS